MRLPSASSLDQAVEDYRRAHSLGPDECPCEYCRPLGAAMVGSVELLAEVSMHVAAVECASEDPGELHAGIILAVKLGLEIGLRAAEIDRARRTQ